MLFRSGNEMNIALKDIVLKVSLELLSDITELQIDVNNEHNKQLSEALDALSLSLASVIEVLNEKI